MIEIEYSKNSNLKRISMKLNNRFKKSQESAGSTKVISREKLNADLPREKANDPVHFLRKLWTAFDSPDYSDEGYSYKIHDVQTNLKFEAYSAQSGPSYGGSVQFYNQKPFDGRLKKEIYQTLLTFDQWIESQEPSNYYEIQYYDDHTQNTIKEVYKKGKITKMFI